MTSDDRTSFQAVIQEALEKQAQVARQRAATAPVRRVARAGEGGGSSTPPRSTVPPWNLVGGVAIILGILAALSVFCYFAHLMADASTDLGATRIPVPPTPAPQTAPPPGQDTSAPPPPPHPVIPTDIPTVPTVTPLPPMPQQAAPVLPPAPVAPRHPRAPGIRDV